VRVFQRFDRWGGAFSGALGEAEGAGALSAGFGVVVGVNGLVVIGAAGLSAGLGVGSTAGLPGAGATGFSIGLGALVTAGAAVLAGAGGAALGAAGAGGLTAAVFVVAALAASTVDAGAWALASSAAAWPAVA